MKKTDDKKIDFAQRISQLEEEIRTTPYHKGTEHHIGKLRAKIAKLKNQEEQATKKAGGSNIGFIPKKGGDATIVLIGPPSVGKSTLLNKLTQAQSRVESWPFTTVKVVPGMWDYQGAKIQIFDLPGIIHGAALGVGRGREVLSATRSAELLILMVDIKTKSQIKSILKELKQVGVSLPVLTVVNKIDLIKETTKQEDIILISVEKEIGLEDLKQKIWEKLGLMRIYLKPKGKEPDFQSPMIMKEDQTINDVIQKAFPEEKTFSQVLIWGPSARFPAQQVSLTHHLLDGDILSFL
jgi:small GTP-binding protein